MPGDMDFAEVIEQAQASVMARAEREAAEAGVTVDELWERQRIADEAEARQQRHLAATEERAERIKAISPGLTAPVAQALCQGALTDDARFPAVRVVREWLANPNSPPIMFLAGGTGCGKTVAAAWALARMGGEYVRAVDLARRSEPYRGEAAELLLMEPHELLVLDDLGTEKRKAAPGGDVPADSRFMPALYDLIDQRQGVIRRGTRWAPRRTLVTLNMSKAVFKAKYPEDRIHSRLAQACSWNALSGGDLRRKGAA